MRIEKELKKIRETTMFKRFNGLWLESWKEVQFIPIIMIKVVRVYVY
jgi:hypothetical protein